MITIFVSLVYMLGFMVSLRLTADRDTALWRSVLASLLWFVWLGGYGMLWLIFETEQK